jgi:type IV fimbrial biogenesis protein FimT
MQRFRRKNHEQQDLLAMNHCALPPLSPSVAESREGGFTLIELLTVLIIVALLGTLAIPNLRTMANNQTLSNTASDLMAAALQARSAALSNNRRTVVQPISSSDWRTGWRVYIDMNSNGAYDSGTDTLVTTHEPLSADISIGSLSGSGDNKSISIIGFGGDGFLEAISGSQNGTVLMQSAYTSRQKYLVVSRMGRARVCDPKTTPGCEPS